MRLLFSIWLKKESIQNHNFLKSLDSRQHWAFSKIDRPALEYFFTDWAWAMPGLGLGYASLVSTCFCLKLIF